MDCRVSHVSSVQVEILRVDAKRRIGNKETSRTNSGVFGLHRKVHLSWGSFRR